MKATAVYGPPGTGKTTWMMNMVQELTAGKYSPADIMYLSFTKAATAEVLRRLNLRKSDTVSTIHSACYRLKRMGGSSMVDYHKLAKFGRQIGMPFSKVMIDDTTEVMEMGDMLLALYNLSRNLQVSINETYEKSDRPASFEEFRYFTLSYDDWKNAQGLIDFPDMLEHYMQDPQEHRCKIVFIDEAQDLSPLQWAVVDKFIKQAGVERVFFAGDDDQAIYEWAGANPHGMSEHEEMYNADRVTLKESHRVPSEVHRIVTNISSRIARRVDKPYAPRSEFGEVLYPPTFNPHDQKEGFILCRTHAIRQKVEKDLIRARIPFLSDSGSFIGPFGSKGVKAARAWKRCKDSGELSRSDVETMIASGVADSVRSDLLTGNLKSILDKDPMEIFPIPHMFVDYFKDVDIYANPKLVTCTIHSAKGREHDNVTLITDWNGRVAAGYAINPDQEHRVWYVGASRAKKCLRITGVGGDGYIM